MSRIKINSKAFTLIEIMASITLFAVITLGIASALRDTTKLTKKLKIREKSTLSVQVAADRLQRDVQHAFNEKLQNAKSLFKSQNVSNGPDFRFSYYDSPIKTLVERRTSGIKVARYTLEKVEGENSLTLFRSEAPLYDAKEIENKPKQIIATGVLKFELEFYDPRNDKWIKEWDDKDRATFGYFPLAVKLYLETVDDRVQENKKDDKSLAFQTSFLIFNEMEGQ
jgi:type II secretion system protein J